MRRKKEIRALGIALLSLCGVACRGRHEEPGRVTAMRVPPALIAARATSQQSAAGALVSSRGSVVRPTKQILFGDLHVHTTFSADAFWRSLPMLQGEGPRPPAEACDFARFCADLDFWALTDHAETLSPRHWRESVESIRECNAAAGEADAVAFLGWEWTQAGDGREDHYGHRTVLLRDADGPGVPARPIAAPNRALAGWREPETLWQRWRWPVLDFAHARRYLDFNRYRDELRDVPLCPSGREVRSLPPDCHELAASPAQLFEKLAQWGAESLVIPHGTTSGFDGGLGIRLAGPEDHPERQTLFEIYSGHGSAEEYRPWRSETRDEQGALACPTPSADHLPCCWRAGELIGERCGESGARECRRRVEAARKGYLAAGQGGFRIVPGASAEDWKDCGQCRDCFNPAFHYRPDGAAQYALARGRSGDQGQPRHLRFGFVGSSASHSARPGNGYKETRRRFTTDASAARDARWRKRLRLDPGGDDGRRASFLRTGGLSAVHATDRGRDQIWAALRRREVYATSGDRILLWFDLVNAPEGRVPMGTETSLASDPIFQVRAIGAAEQLAGCPDAVATALSPARLEALCGGECYHPGTERRVIARIEVVRIRPQQREEEAVDSLIEDPWRRFACPADPAGCVIEFTDPEFVAAGREALYYVRAIQEPTPAINAGGLRCEANGADLCATVRPCHADDRTDSADDCLGLNEERAWSSPIFVQFAP
jgi:hypothetical protein